MPRKKLTHPFQFELLRQQKDKNRIVRKLKLRQHIYSAQLSESGELDSNSNLDEETDSEDSFPNLKENSLKPFESREFILGLIIGIFIRLCFGFVFPNQYTYFLTPHK